MFEFEHTYDLFSVMRLIARALPEIREYFFKSNGERHAPEINYDVERWLEAQNERPFFLFWQLLYKQHQLLVKGLQSFVTEQLVSELSVKSINQFKELPFHRIFKVWCKTTP